MQLPPVQPLTVDDVAAAAARIGPHTRRTPIFDVEIDGKPLLLKLEHLQRSGSFKIRGALNSLLSGPRPDRVVTASGGNHGLAVATAAAELGVPATVFVPVTVPESKARRIEAAGAELVRCGATYAEAAAAARAEPGRYVHAYDAAATVAGQGTAAAEIVADAPDVRNVVVAAGGGGLAAGTALAVGSRRVVTVEPEHCRAVHAALTGGAPVDVPVDSVAASALGATRIGDLPFAVLRAADTVPLLVTDAEIVAARDRLWEELRLRVELAAAASFAAWLAGRTPAGRTCLLLCGAND